MTEATAIGSTALIVALWVLLIWQDIERGVRYRRELRTDKPLSFAPPGQGRPAAAQMGRLTPDRPPRTGLFFCRYCGRYGKAGACEGCGAPNGPAAAPERPTVPENRIVRAGVLTVNEARERLGMNPIPSFPMVKR
jgi:hypothetical protein